MLCLSEEILHRKSASTAPRTIRNETCGAMLGVDGDAGREVRALFPLINRRDDSPRNRFSVTADDFRAAERAAAEQGLELIGLVSFAPRPSGAAQRIRPRACLAVVQLRDRERRLPASRRI